MSFFFIPHAHLRTRNDCCNARRNIRFFLCGFTQHFLMSLCTPKTGNDCCNTRPDIGFLQLPIEYNGIYWLALLLHLNWPFVTTGCLLQLIRPFVTFDLGVSCIWLGLLSHLNWPFISTDLVFCYIWPGCLLHLASPFTIFELTIYYNRLGLLSHLNWGFVASDMPF